MCIWNVVNQLQSVTTSKAEFRETGLFTFCYLEPLTNGLSIKEILQLLVVDIENNSESVSVLSMLKAEMNLNMCQEVLEKCIIFLSQDWLS